MSSTKKGSVDIKEYFHAWDTANQTPKTGLLYTSPGGRASHVRNGAESVSIALATLASASADHSDGGFVEVDANKDPGLYRFDPPDAAYAAGVDNVVVKLLFDDVYIEALRVGLVDNIEKDTYDEVTHADYSLEVIKRYVRNIAGFVKHERGNSWPMGVPYYWDPVSGNDGNDGLAPETAKLTFAATLAMTMAYCHDSVVVVNTTGAPLVVDTKVDVSTAKVHLIGDGNTTIKPSSSGAATVVLSAKGCHVEGLNIETHTTGNENAIEVIENECEVHLIRVPYCRAAGIVLNNVNDCIIHNVVLRNPGVGGNGHGIQINDFSAGNQIHDIDILGAAGDGINLNGSEVEENTISAGDGTSIIHESVNGYGIREQGGADKNEIIGPNLLLEGNALGQYLLNANSIIINTSQYARYTDLPANFVDMAITATTGLVDITQAAADKVWASATRELTSFGTLVVDVTDQVWDEILSGHTTASSAGKYLSDLIDRIGAFAGSSDNTILGFLRAIMRKDVSAPSEVGGTYDPTLHSNEAILNRGNVAWSSPGGGGGANNFNITVKIDDEFGATLAGVDVQVMDTGETTTIARLITGSAGLVNVDLDNDDYHVFFRGTGFQTVGGNPITMTVSGDTDQEEYMEAFDPGAPAAVDLCRVTNWHIDGKGNPEEGKTWSAKITVKPTISGDSIVSYKAQDSTESAALDGYNYLDLIRTAVYEVDIDGNKYPITVPDLSTKKLKELIT